MRGAIEDMHNDTAEISSQDLLTAQDTDYYYDFREDRSVHISQGAWFTYCYDDQHITPSLTTILLGVTPTRPLIFNSEALLRVAVPSTRRGGNTYFANAKDLLAIPHVALCVDGLSTRRSDMIVAEVAKVQGVIYRETYFPLGHLRITTSAMANSQFALDNIEAELFGVSLHRGIQSFVASCDYIRAWKDIYARRLDHVLETCACIREVIASSPALGEMKQLRDAFDCKFSQERFTMQESRFFREYLSLVGQYYDLCGYWMRLLDGHKYEVDY